MQFALCIQGYTSHLKAAIVSIPMPVHQTVEHTVCDTEFTSKYVVVVQAFLKVVSNTEPLLRKTCLPVLKCDICFCWDRGIVRLVTNFLTVCSEL